VLLFFLLVFLTVVAAMDRAWPASVILGLAAAGLALRSFGDCATAMAYTLWALHQSGTTEEQQSL
jgi:hypothetical protein